MRLAGCMSAVSGTLPFPASGVRVQAKTRVDHRNSEEASLVRRVQARDEIAFGEIVERYQAKVFSIIFGILRNHNDAEDIAQQVFAKIYFSIQSFDFRTLLLVQEKFPAIRTYYLTESPGLLNTDFTPEKLRVP